MVLKNSTKLCSSKQIVTVNGKFPGPTIYAREDDTLLVKVVNHVKYNLSIHWWVSVFFISTKKKRPTDRSFTEGPSCICYIPYERYNLTFILCNKTLEICKAKKNVSLIPNQCYAFPTSLDKINIMYILWCRVKGHKTNRSILFSSYFNNLFLKYYIIISMEYLIKARDQTT